MRPVAVIGFGNLTGGSHPNAGIGNRGLSLIIFGPLLFSYYSNTVRCTVHWMGPVLHHPRLWHVNRRGIALGLSIGVFFGLLIPVAQILFAATAALLLRANFPAASAAR